MGSVRQRRVVSAKASESIYEPTHSSSSESCWKNCYKYVGLGLSVGLFMGFFFYRRYRRLLDITDDEAKQNLSMFSESAFYFSFFNDTVKSSTIIEAFKKLLWDSRSEHPSIINAFKRYNIFQEVLLGVLYRFYPLNYIFSTPFNFYASTVFCLMGLGVGALVWMSSNLGGSVLCGVCTLGFFLANFSVRFIVRLSSIPLRENWATPFLWTQTGILLYMLTKRKETNKLKAAFAITSLCFLTLWQFSGFLMTLQAASLYATLLLGFPILQKVKSIYLIYASVYIALTVMHFFPKYLLCALFPQVIISVLPVLYFYPPKSFTSSDDSKTKDKFEKPSYYKVLAHNFSCGVLTLVIFSIVRCGITNLVEMDDSHVFQMLGNKLGLSKPDFDTQIYLMGGSEFDTIAQFHIDIMQPSKLHILAPLVMIVILIISLIILIGSGRSRVDWCVFALQTFFFGLLMVLVSRLRVISVPLLCVTCGMITSPILWDSIGEMLFKRKFSKWLSLPLRMMLVFLPFYLRFPFDEMTSNPSSENAYNEDKLALLKFMEQNLPPDAAILADMPFSSSIRVHSPTLRTVLNPQYEDVSVRQKVQFLYGASACADMEKLSKTLRGLYKAEYLVLSVYRCAAPQDKSVISVFDVSAHLDDKADICAPEITQFERFCWRVQFEESNLFQVLHRNGTYTLIKVLGGIPSTDGISTKDVSIPAHDPIPQYGRLNVKSMMTSSKIYEKWSDTCDKVEHDCGLYMLRLAQKYDSLWRLTKESEVLRQYAISKYPISSNVNFIYAQHIDFDQGRPKDALKYYKTSINRRLPLLYSPNVIENEQGNAHLRGEKTTLPHLPDVTVDNIASKTSLNVIHKENSTFVDFAQLAEFILVLEEIDKQPHTAKTILSLAKLFTLLLHRTDLQLYSFQSGSVLQWPQCFETTMVVAGRNI